MVKEASILTLGFICESIKDKTNFRFTPHEQEAILTAIMLGVQQPALNIVETSLTALRNSVSSFYEILQQPQACEYILSKVVEIIHSGKYLVECLQILGELVRSAYQGMGKYTENFYQLLGPIISNTNNEDDYDACVSAMEIFENMAEYYRD